MQEHRIQASWGLTPKQHEILLLLRTYRWRSPVDIIVRADMTPEAACYPLNNVRVQMHKIRNKLEIAGLTIDGVRFLGFKISRKEDALSRREALFAQRIGKRGFIVPESKEAEFRFLKSRDLALEEIRQSLRLPAVNPLYLSAATIRKAMTQ